MNITSAILWGNITSLIAAILAAVSGAVKKKRHMLVSYAAASAVYALSDFILKGYSGTAQNIVAFFRNISALWLPQAAWLNWTFVIAGTLLGIVFNNTKWIGLLSVLLSIPYAVLTILPHSKERDLRIAMIIQCIGYGIFSLYLYSIVGAVTNGITIVTTAAALIRDGKKK